MDSRPAYVQTQPNHIIYVKDPPLPSQPEAMEAFETIMKNQRGFVAVRYFGRQGYVEFKETADAQEVIHKYNGHKYHHDAYAMRLEFDRDAGKPKKRKFDFNYDSRYPETHGRYPSPPRHSSYRAPERDYPSRAEPARQALSGNDSYYPSSNYPSHRDREPLRDQIIRDPSPARNSSRLSTSLSDKIIINPPPRAYYDPYIWMKSFMPYWETTGNIPADPIGRMELNSHKLTQSCPTLFVHKLPTDITKRELQLMFCWLPNFLAVRIVSKQLETIAFIDFVDAASAYVAMACMQGFYITGHSIGIEYDKWTDRKPDNK
jgi:hypothetical protein